MRAEHRSQWIIAAVIVLALVGIILWYTNLEWEERQVDGGPSAEVQRNPYLALQMHLQKQGVDSDFHRGFSGLDRLQVGDAALGSRDALVLIHTYQGLNDNQVEALWQWVEQGGTLVITADNPFVKAASHLDDSLLNRLGLALETTQDRADEDDSDDEELEDDAIEDDEQESATLPDDENETVDDAQPSSADDQDLQEQSLADDIAEDIDQTCSWLTYTSLDMPQHSPAMSIAVSRYSSVLYVYDEIADVFAYQNSDGDNVAVAHLPVGTGNIYAYASDFSLVNRRVACEDNGYAFLQMVQNRDKVWFAVNANRPSFWHELWRLSAAGCLALLGALGLWVWQRSVRFGRILQIDRSHRRHFIDHIRASAMFVFRNRGSATLIQTLRDDIHQKMQLKHGNFGQLSAEKQREKFQQLSAMPNEDLELAMFHPLPLPKGTLIDAVRRLQHLRNSL